MDRGAGEDADCVRAVEVSEADTVAGGDEAFTPGGPVSVPQDTGMGCVRDVRGRGGGAESAAGVTVCGVGKHGI